MDTKRMKVDCREAGLGCSVTISGTEEEVRKIAKRHGIEEHGFKDDAELDKKIGGLLKPEGTESYVGVRGKEKESFGKGASA